MLLPVAIGVLLAIAAAAPAGATTTVAIQKGNPRARGDDGPNRITVSAVDEGRAFAFEDPAGVVAGAGCTQITPTRATCPRIPHPTECDGDVCSTQVEAINVIALGGDDDVRVGYGEAAATWPQSSAFVDAGPGDDFVGGTPVVDYELNGGPGDDVVDGAGYNDGLDGGGGRDRLYGGPGQDELDDGDGNRKDADLLDGGPCDDPRCATAGPLEPGDAQDEVTYGRRRKPVFVDLRSTAAIQGERGEGDTVRGVEMVFGGDAADRLVTSGTGRLLGGAGDDTLFTLGDGKAFVNCGDGIDIVVTTGRDDLFDCESECARLAGCPRPRVTIRGLPKCAQRTFTARIRVRGVRGFREIVARLDEHRIGRTHRRDWRLEVTMDGAVGYSQLEIAVKGNRWTRVYRELNSCRPVP